MKIRILLALVLPVDLIATSIRIPVFADQIAEEADAEISVRTASPSDTERNGLVSIQMDAREETALFENIVLAAEH